MILRPALLMINDLLIGILYFCAYVFQRQPTIYLHPQSPDIIVLLKQACDFLSPNFLLQNFCYPFLQYIHIRLLILRAPNLPTQPSSAAMCVWNQSWLWDRAVGGSLGHILSHSSHRVTARWAPAAVDNQEGSHSRQLRWMGGDWCAVLRVLMLWVKG